MKGGKKRKEKHKNSALFIVRMAAAQRQGDEKGGRWVWWAVFAVVSVGCGLFAVEMFPEAFPMASLTISMQRPHALHSALNVPLSFNVIIYLF
jgi:hypothetical protein